MTIKEVEARTGMTRANIRFYESEGLITPARGSNGYRDYSEQEVELLLRVKLLRMLEMPLEEIKGLCRGEEELLPVLDGHICRLEEQQTHMERSQQVCLDMRRDEVRFDTLDPNPYLTALAGTRTVSPVGRPSVPPRELSRDVVPKVYSPWRRLFARILDEQLYMLLCYLILVLLMRENVLNNSSFYNLVVTVWSVVLMLLLEPLMLRFFGTTPGKAILGLRVTEGEWDRVSYPVAFVRTWKVLVYGHGLHLPVYSLIRQWKSYKGCTSGETLPWEEESVLELKDKRWWRNVAAVAAWLMIVAATVLVLVQPPRASYRGELTVAQFCQNYNYLARYYGVQDLTLLDDEGNWLIPEYVAGLDTAHEVVFSFEERDGALRQVSFSLERENESFFLFSQQTEMLLTIQSFAPENLSNEALAEIDALLEHPLEDWQTTAFGMTITCEVEYSGFTEIHAGAPALYPEEEINDYSVTFTVARAE